MGQSPLVDSAREQPSRQPSRASSASSFEPSTRRTDGNSSERTAAGTSRSRGNQDGSQPPRSSKSSMAANCCMLPIGNPASITDSNGKTIRTDISSLSDVNGDGVGCGEVFRALCMVNPGGHREDEVSIMEGSDYLNVHHRRDDAEVSLRRSPAQLQVPPQFKGISYDWRLPSASQTGPSPRQQEKLQNCMKPFIQSMLIGVLVCLRLEPGEAPGGDPSGKSIDATVTLSEDFSILQVAAGSAQRSVSIKAIRLVRPPEQGRDRCADLRLSGGLFMRFHFDTQAQADFFGTCMRLLVKAARSTAPTQV